MTIDDCAIEFYKSVLAKLLAYDVPFLVGGAYASQHHARVIRHTRDLNVFMLPEDGPRTIERFARDGYTTSLTFAHWLGKIKHEANYVDVIFSSGNGIARVDQAWFEHAVPGEVLGLAVRSCPVEETISSKSSAMERERFDGSDV